MNTFNRVSDLEFRTHASEDAPEDLNADLKHLRDGADGISAQAQTQVLCNGLDEGCRVVRGAGVDDGLGGRHQRHVIVQDRQNEVQRKQLGAHCM